MLVKFFYRLCRLAPYLLGRATFEGGSAQARFMQMPDHPAVSGRRAHHEFISHGTAYTPLENFSQIVRQFIDVVIHDAFQANVKISE